MASYYLNGKGVPVNKAESARYNKLSLELLGYDEQNLAELKKEILTDLSNDKRMAF